MRSAFTRRDNIKRSNKRKVSEYHFALNVDSIKWLKTKKFLEVALSFSKYPRYIDIELSQEQVPYLLRDIAFYKNGKKWLYTNSDERCITLLYSQKDAFEKEAIRLRNYKEKYIIKLKKLWQTIKKREGENALVEYFASDKEYEINTFLKQFIDYDYILNHYERPSWIKYRTDDKIYIPDFYKGHFYKNAANWYYFAKIIKSRGFVNLPKESICYIFRWLDGYKLPGAQIAIELLLHDCPEILFIKNFDEIMQYAIDTYRRVFILNLLALWQTSGYKNNKLENFDVLAVLYKTEQINPKTYENKELDKVISSSIKIIHRRKVNFGSFV